jgi:hypothetical protein
MLSTLAPMKSLSRSRSAFVRWESGYGHGLSKSGAGPLVRQPRPLPCSSLVSVSQFQLSTANPIRRPFMAEVEIRLPRQPSARTESRSCNRYLTCRSLKKADRRVTQSNEQCVSFTASTSRRNPRLLHVSHIGERVHSAWHRTIRLAYSHRE